MGLLEHQTNDEPDTRDFTVRILLLYIHVYTLDTLLHTGNPPADFEKQTKQEILNGIWKNKLFDETFEPGLCGT